MSRFLGVKAPEIPEATARNLRYLEDFPPMPITTRPNAHSAQRSIEVALYILYNYSTICFLHLYNVPSTAQAKRSAIINRLATSGSSQK